MRPERTATINGHTVAEYYWAGDMVVYLDRRATEMGFEQACSQLQDIAQDAIDEKEEAPAATTDLREAEISACGQYRYWLGRQWDAGAARLPIIMLNPSTADAKLDDPTIRRCTTFARREGFGGIMVFNLFAYRATSPDDMKAATDPVGPMNDYWLNRVLDASSASGIPILAAWGAHGDYRARANYVRGMANLRAARLVSLGTTKDGHPRHPLYVKGDQPFLEFGA